ncbi:hypothetical protein [Maribacter aquivivus]|uniref:hypothetical protein n=1 Tax=Maribacter aquivivus TaxID=228958 RepID=UPI0024949496|nr:hypothetical protein [Maribacter aquivivus]
MKELDVSTGIMRENICRYINELMRLGLVAVVRKRRCSITHHPNVKEYTADYNLFPKSNQLELF